MTQAMERDVTELKTTLGNQSTDIALSCLKSLAEMTMVCDKEEAAEPAAILDAPQKGSL